MKFRTTAIAIVTLALQVTVNAGSEITATLHESDGSLSFNGDRFVRYSEITAESVIDKRKTSTYMFHVFCTIACILFAALAAGLTMGLVSLEPFDMKILMEANEADCLSEVEREELRKEKEYAQSLYPLISRHHLLLVTLLLMNSIANEALPLFLNEIVSPVVAVTMSVTAVLIFGEILPSALFTGPNQLAIGASLAPLVWFFIYCFWIISYPISLILDKMLGEEHKGRYNKAEFRALINLHNEATEDDISAEAVADEENALGSIGQPGLAGVRAELGAKQILNRSGIAKQELRIMTGALELHRLKVKDVMLPLDDVYMLSTDAKLDSETLSSILQAGHSRVPVYQGHPHNIRGMLLIKRLIVLNPEEKREVGSLPLLEPLVVDSECSLLDLLYMFSEGKSHLALICSDPERVTQALRTGSMIPPSIHMGGIVTLEDVIERLIKHEIQDESDMSVRSLDNPLEPARVFDATSFHEDDGLGSSAVKLSPPYSVSRIPAPMSTMLGDRITPDHISIRSSPLLRPNSSLSARSGGRTPTVSTAPVEAPKNPLTIPLLGKGDRMKS
jgi:metal transporter CNNM